LRDGLAGGRGLDEGHERVHHRLVEGTGLLFGEVRAVAGVAAGRGVLAAARGGPVARSDGQVADHAGGLVAGDRAVHLVGTGRQRRHVVALGVARTQVGGDQVGVALREVVLYRAAVGHL